LIIAKKREIKEQADNMWYISQEEEGGDKESVYSELENVLFA
jgi:hypothetical protein